MSSTSDPWIASAEAESFDIMPAEFDCLAIHAHVLMLRNQGIMPAADAGAALDDLAARLHLHPGVARLHGHRRGSVRCRRQLTPQEPPTHQL
jgi:hypothetical protein